MGKKAVGLILFDTLNFVEKLEKSGFMHDQATGLAKAQAELLSNWLEETLVTKSDLLRVDLEGQMKDLRKEMNHLFLTLSTRMKRLMLTFFLGTVCAFSLIMALFKFIH